MIIIVIILTYWYYNYFTDINWMQ